MGSGHQQVDLKSLAQQLGLSMTTVSRALNGYPDVSPSTRARIVETARALGYTPNAQARRLTRGRTESVGFVMSDVDAYHGDPYFAQLLAGFSDVLNGHGYDLVLACAASPTDQLPAYRRLVEEKRVDGLLLDRTRLDDDRIDYLLARGFPFVTLGRDNRQDEHAYLDIDSERAFIEAAERLIALGHRRIALIGFDEAYTFVHLRCRGFHQALARHGLALDPRLYANRGCNEEGAAEAARGMLRLADPPTAFLCIDDLTAMGVMRGCRELGLAPGRDISIIGYNDIPVATTIDPPLTTMRVPIRIAGRRLATMLLAIIDGDSPEAYQEVWPAELVLRGSHGPCRRRAGAAPPRPPLAAAASPDEEPTEPVIGQPMAVRHRPGG